MATFDPRSEYSSLSSYFDRLKNGPPFEPGEEMIYEIIRLNSFTKWPASAQVSTIFLARAGFSYAGKDDEVICFSCKVKIRNWEKGDDPLKEHKKWSAKCKFLLGIDKRNVSMYPESKNCRDEEVTSATNGLSSIVAADGPSEMNSLVSESAESVKMYSKQPVKFASHTTRDAPQPVRQQAPQYPPYSFDPLNAMKEESARLQTFRNWPRDAPVTKEELSRAGFFYTGSADMVKCAFCSGMIRNWEPGDTAMGEHRRYFSSCSFVRNHASDVFDGRPRNVPDSAPTLPQFGLEGDTDSPIVTAKPKHPKYAIESNRLNSFKNWPFSKSQRPDELADAGFFYAGFNDNVKCFFCDGGLRNWEPGDQPWTEHARWFPKCGYVKQCKGIHFIKTVAETGNPPHEVTMADMDVIMSGNHVKTALEVGFPKEKVQYVVESRVKSNGTMFGSAEELINTLAELNDDSWKTRTQNGNREVPLNGHVESDCPTDLQTDADLTSVRVENENLKEKRQCRVCFDKELSVVLLPCAHLVCCTSCAPALKACPVCRNNIKGTVRTYLA